MIAIYRHTILNVMNNSKVEQILACNLIRAHKHTVHQFRSIGKIFLIIIYLMLINKLLMLNLQKL
jgi:hypothetical protein